MVHTSVTSSGTAEIRSPVLIQSHAVAAALDGHRAGLERPAATARAAHGEPQQNCDDEADERSRRSA